MTLRARVLGSAAGGGFPQWNCGCRGCSAVRRGEPGFRARTQASLALSADGERWLLVNASPDVRAQLEAFPALHPRALRDSPVAGLVLTNGDVDACLGLFVLREDQTLVVHATSAVERGLREHNALVRTLERRAGQVGWRRLPLGERVVLGGATGLELTAIPVPGTVPLHLKGLVEPSREDNIALLVGRAGTGPGGRLLYAPTVGGWSAELEEAARAAEVVLFDGTFFADDELRALGLGTRSARDMAHWPLGGPEGSLRWLARLPCRRKLLVHINNTNPILCDDAPERAEVLAAGVEVAVDGLELEVDR